MDKNEIKIKTALISLFDKEKLPKLAKLLNEFGVVMMASGGTYDAIIKLGYSATSTEELTGYPSILGGRVKTLQPQIFGGILARRGDKNDKREVREYDIPLIDLVVVDTYPFLSTVESGASYDDCIEKIDIGGPSLLRAAAKNMESVLCLYGLNDGNIDELTDIFQKHKGMVNFKTRQKYATHAFEALSNTEKEIFEYLRDNADKA